MYFTDKENQKRLIDNRIFVVLLLSIPLSFGLYTPSASAVRPYGMSVPAKPDIEVLSDTAVADGVSSIMLRVTQVRHTCANNGDYGEFDSEPWICADGSNSVEEPNRNQFAVVSVSGSGNTFDNSYPCSNIGTGRANLDENGTATICLQSTVAETKSVQLSQIGPDGAWAIHSTPIEVTFTPPEESSVVQHTADGTNTPSGDEERGIPAPPYIDSVIRGDLTLENSGDLVFAQGDDFTIGGSTSPGAIVKLYIFSTPSEATVVAGEDGRWTYTISGLEPGTHHIEAEVTDQEGYNSERSTIMSFAITAEPALSNAEKHVMNDTKSTSRIMYIVLGIVVLVMGVVVFLTRKRLATPLASLRTKMDPAVKRLRTLVHFKKK